MDNIGKTATLLCISLVAAGALVYYGSAALNWKPMTAAQEAGLTAVVKVCGWISTYCFVAGEIFRNNSQVDKIWGITPIVYAAILTWYSGWNDRVLLMTLLIFIWGWRISANFARRGGMNMLPWKGEEDYRWEVLRQNAVFKGKPLIWGIFNLLFISFYQNILLLLIALPVFAAWQGAAPLGWADLALTIVFFTLLYIEWKADEEQFIYQEEKWRRIKAGEELGPYYGKGFTHTGLWAKCAHPNYAAEQSMWVVIYLFSIPATGNLFNWSILGVVLLVLLFKGSADFSEEITLKKYAGYEQYLKTVPRFIPRLW